jgi:hypothetical protein
MSILAVPVAGVRIKCRHQAAWQPLLVDFSEHHELIGRLRSS